jgi:hypothetical protein
VEDKQKEMRKMETKLKSDYRRAKEAVRILELKLSLIKLTNEASKEDIKEVEDLLTDVKRDIATFEKNFRDLVKS